MITQDEARDRARERMSAPEVGLHEFALGWVAWPLPPAAADTRPPAAVGGPQVVVDRATGEVTGWPPLPPAAVAERYTTLHAARERFPADVARVLADAGWTPGRDVGAEVDAWIAADEPGPVFPAARAMLAEFGGLVLAQYGPQGTLVHGLNSHFHPTGADVLLGRSAGHTQEYGDPAFPLGWNDDDGEIAIDAAGRMFFLHWSDTFFLGADPDAGLTALVRGGTWPTADDPGWPAEVSRSPHA